MPTYPHRCNFENCLYEWDDFYSIKAEPPKICPKCNREGKVERLIGGGSGKGIVELTGQELTEKIKSQAAQIGKQASRNENTLANLVGNDTFHKNELLRSRIRREK